MGASEAVILLNYYGSYSKLILWRYKMTKFAFKEIEDE